MNRLSGRVCTLAAALLVTTAGVAWATEPVTVYVAPDGRPDWSGTLPRPNADSSDGPLPSPLAARDLIRDRRGRGEWTNVPINVILAPGTYELTATLVLGPEESGTATNPITWKAATDRPTILSGGRTITGWRETTVNGHTAWRVDLPEVKQGAWDFHQLFVNGQRRPRPRTPREGFYRFSGLPQLRPGAPYNEGHDRANFEPGHIRSGRNLGDVEVVICHFWVAPRLRIAEIDDATNLVRFTEKTHRRLTDSFHMDRFARYYVDNVYEALDEPGEWYLDRPEGALLYIPKPGETPGNTTITAPRLDCLVRIAGSDDDHPAAFINLEGLDLRHCEWFDPSQNVSDGQSSISVPGVLQLQHARNCAVRDCTVANASNYAIDIGPGCQDVTVVRNTLTDLGAGGVKLGHGSVRTTCTDNEIGPGGHVFHNAVGVWIGHSSHNLVAHNHIHHFYYTGVSVGWSWNYGPTKAAHNVIESNHIHDLGQGWLGDMGGIYTLGVSPGTVLRHNLIHDVHAEPYGGWGLYNDEGSTGILMENNVVYNTTHGGYHQHYGRENVIRNNIFAFGKHAQVMRSREEDHISFTFEHNIVFFEEGKLLDGKWNNDRFRFDHNLYWHIGGKPFDFAGASLEQWQARGHDRQAIIADPRFADPAGRDFHFQSDSPAKQIDFQPIDLATVGPRPRSPR